MTIINSLRKTTQKQYTVYINKFMKFCNFENVSSFQPTEIDVINFLQSLYESGLSYSVINTASSAVKTFLELLNYRIVFSSRLTRFKKGCFNQRPALPRHVSTWDPQIVLDYFEGMGNDLALLPLTCKCATLLALASYQRVSTLHSLKVNDISFRSDKAIISFNALHKQSRPGSHLTGIELDSFDNSTTCVVKTLMTYFKATESLRVENGLSSFFITCVKPYRNASKDTVSRWIKSTIHKAGVPDDFSAHSTRSASTSADASKGMDVMSILRKAGWSSASVFNKFYNKPFLKH